MIKKEWITRIPDRTPEWYAYRANGLGASNAGLMIGVMPYRPVKMELYHQKVGTEEDSTIMNAAMFHGIYDEKKVADLWQYYDGNEDGYIFRYEQNDVQRKMHQLVGFVTNPKYPWLYCNLDRLINKGSRKLNLDGTLSDEILTENCPLECKTMSRHVYDAWNKGIPEYHIAQVHQQMMIMEVDYAEIAILIDGRELVVYPIYRNDSIVEQIEQQSMDFWARVEKGREYFKAAQECRKNNDEKGYEENMAIVYSMEPEPDESPAYREYLSERHLAREEEEDMLGSDELLEQVKDLQSVKGLIKSLTAKKNGLENKIKHHMVQEFADRLTFPGSGYIRYYMRSGNKVKQLDVRIDKPNAYNLDLEVEKLNPKVGYTED